MKFCQEWSDTIGNFRAWPAEDNRSDQTDLAGQKINDEELLRNSFIIIDEMTGFNQGNDIISKAESAKMFAEACKCRMLRIYKEWYASLKIVDLLN